MKRKFPLPAIAAMMLFACKKDIEKSMASALPIPATTAVAAVLPSSDFKGVNWADTRDNFADDELVLSGTTISDSYATIQTKADYILSGFQTAGANTVRLPVNPPTVLGTWWQAYKGAIDKASTKNMKVLLAYWEGASSRNGLIDNTTTFWQMWDAIIAAYRANPLIYFEVFNEPHGYSATDLLTLYNQFVTRYPGVPENRFVLDGTGYSTGVNTVGADTRFDSCLLSFHDYTWFESSKTTTADWEQPVKSLAYPGRTIVTEFGTVMTDGTNYSGAPGSNVNNTYLQGMTNSLRELGVGCVYWPGLRTGDTYSMFTANGTSLATNNSSGLARLKYAWGTGTITPPYASFTTGAYYKVINKHSGKALEVYNQLTTNGAAMDQWDYWGGNNQQWSFNALGSNYFSVINRNSAKSLDVNGQSTAAGAAIVQWDYSGGNNQQWQIVDIGFGYYKLLNRNSGFSLDVNGQSTANGGNVIQWNWNSGANQQWQITTP
ncbi:Ricin-type beta-trefoil lectin domain-like [Chitinophaga sp. YR627]|uniref:RICIN domain-containing protein n=1 Tax=Chitinophaga sp. YR627 TaxID=1881041 RepID=UPI0008F2B94C|nr:RICIN domain-containing protein [Chitinophaga sp. YR627]SFN32279.1 Ricin-type beta-trefoil lectin domain-like [Chitinophaga sp. YR627]